MSKILIEGSKVIIDGHASDLETCNTLTNLCDELSTSEKFRTVRYESGYGEFESVSENKKKKFAKEPGTVTLYIKSNDGSSTLYSSDYNNNHITITTTGVSWRSNGLDQKYIYTGSKIFLGLSNTPNATVAKYTYGSTISVDEYDTRNNFSLYIVENIIIPEHHSSLTELFTNIAAVIREKTGDTASIVADDFPNVIRERLQMIPQVTLISFKIDGKSYQAEEGMTWGEWINSEYSSFEQTRRCSTCGATESLGKHTFTFVASGTGFGWASSKGCEYVIKRLNSPTTVASSEEIDASTDYITRQACAD